MDCLEHDAGKDLSEKRFHATRRLDEGTHQCAKGKSETLS